MTIAEKILARHAGRSAVRPGELVTVQVDTVIVLDLDWVAGMGGYEILRLQDPGKVVVVHDHLVPVRDIEAGEALQQSRAFAERFGIERVHDAGADQGIVHQLVADRAYGLPGEILICADSHTCAAGAFNCAARGLGGPEVNYALCKGESWFRIGETVRYELEGALRPGVTAKDTFLHLAGEYGSHAGANIEYGGPGQATLSLDARRTLATMSAELSAEFAIWEPDEVLLDHVRPRAARPFTEVTPDPDATYRDVRRIRLDGVEPYLGLPDSLVHNTVPFSTFRETVPVDQCFVGSCANGTLEDLAIAAAVVRGKRVAPGVRFIVTPGSQEIYRSALHAGYVETLTDAGAVVTPSACGACGGLSMGVLGPGETCITSSTRNFKGRMGSPEARIFMASSAAVAASALTGTITDPRTVGAELA
jgi:3-isopropylmalate/(R)-2-methylmalate dehydratase large subunit